MSTVDRKQCPIEELTAVITEKRRELVRDIRVVHRRNCANLAENMLSLKAPASRRVSRVFFSGIA